MGMLSWFGLAWASELEDALHFREIDQRNCMRDIGQLTRDLQETDRRLVTKELEINEHLKTIHNQREQIGRINEQVNEANRALLRARQDLITANQQLDAIRSVPVWRRIGRKFVPLSPGDSPIGPEDETFAAIGKVAGQAAANEIVRLAFDDGNDVARFLLARARPFTIEGQRHAITAEVDDEAGEDLTNG